MIYRLFICLSFFFVMSCQAATSNTSKTSQKPIVHFAGLVFTGSYQDINANFKHTITLNKDGELYRALFEYIQSKHSPYYQLEFGLADIEKGESLVMAVAVDREFINREVYRFNNELFTRVIGDITIQILMINFESLVIEAAYPLSFAINDVLPGDVTLSPAYKERLFRRLYMGDSVKDKGFLPQIADLALTIHPETTSRTRVALRSVVISDEAVAMFPVGRSREQVEHFIGSTFTAKMAEHFDIQVIPYSRDYAISGQMATRFSNGKVYNLKLPTPNLVLELDLQKFKKLELKPLVYSTLMQVSLKSAIHEHVYFDDTFRGWVSKYEGEFIEDWPAYEDSVEVLLSELAEQLVNPSRRWFVDHAKGGVKTFKKSNNVRKYFKNET